MNFTTDFLQECGRIIREIPTAEIEGMVDVLVQVRDRRGRLFIIGNGGGLGTASHAAADFRAQTGIQALAPESPTELTAIANDFGFDSTFATWLTRHCLHRLDALLVLSVGGGVPDGTSANIVAAGEYAKLMDSPLLSIVGLATGYAHVNQTAGTVLPSFVGREWITAHAEWVQSMVLHLLVSHPRLQVNKPIWAALEDK
jgi:D-sedoheptulose 7-phosphate isomerase